MCCPWLTCDNSGEAKILGDQRRKKNHRAILFLFSQLLITIPRTKGFKYCLPHHFNNCLFLWGILKNYMRCTSRTKRKAFLLVMKWWVHTKWFLTFSFGLCDSFWIIVLRYLLWVCSQSLHEIWQQMKQIQMPWYANYLLCHELKRSLLF